MPKRPSSYDRESRRYSSGTNSLSSSSIVTVRGPDAVRPSSSSRLLSKPLSGSTIVTQTAEIRGPSPNYSSSPSKRLSNASSGRSDQGLNNRWSQSSASNPSLNHLRTSSFSRRFSLAVPSPRSSYRSTSPPKSRDAQTEASVSPSRRSSVENFRPLSPRSQRHPPTSYPHNERLDITSRSPSFGPPSPDRRHQPSQYNRNGSNLQGSPRKSSHDKRPGSSGTKNSQNLFRDVTQSTTTRNAQPSDLRSNVSSREGMGSRDSQSGPSGSRDSMSGRPYEKHKKALLSEALQRANDAVQLDNDADYYRAVVAYNEACNLLNDVVQRSSSADDQRKLTAIRTTYMTRVQELQPLAGRKSRSSSQNTGSRPGTSEARKQKSGIQQLDGTSDAGNRTRAATSRNASGAATTLRFLGSENPTISNAKASEITSGLHGNAWARSALTEQPPSLQSGPQNLPPPLSPRRSPAPQSQWPPSDGEEVSSEPWRESGIVDKRPRPRDSDGSWFNAGGEELASLHLSNHHSVSSLAGLRRRDLRNNQGDTEAEFDAALDAAVEAAYNDGYEPYDDKYMNEGKIHDEREARIRAEKNAAATSRLHQEALHQTQGGSDDGSVVDSDEEERLLDQVTRGFPDEAQSASRQQPSQPRQSDSSGFSNRTYGSSVASSLTTAGTSLSTVDEVLSVPLPNAKPETAKQLPPLPQSSNRPPIPHSPPIIQRPKDAIEGSRDAPQSAWMQSPEMRQRRMSETGKKLKIETAVLPSQAGLDKDLQKDQSMEPLSKVQSANSVSSAKTAPTGRTDDSRLSPLELTAVSAKSTSPSGALQLSSPYPSPFVGSFPPDIMSSSVPLSSTMSNDSKFVESPASDTLISPVYPTGRGLKQSGSTSNLNRLVSEEMDPSPATPMSFSFSSTMSPQLQQDEFERRVGEPNNREDTVPASKIKLFDNEMHFRGYDCPRPLEACPESVLLRPFWLMRCFYQTLSNPKGGYLSTRLFVPHDVWKVKAPKLKAIEDKIATCDYLTAALLKLSTVDPLDADAIHDEMMGFEQLLDETQATLSKKLGSDVGTHNASALFKDAVPGAPPNASESTSTQAGTEGKSASTGSQSGKHGSKSWQSSWRKKLRNKSSNNPVASNYTTLKEGSERTMTMSSLPMQPLEVARSRPIKREISGNNMAVPKIDGPNANYASSVAKLCDAAQVLDQIARQAEDPGLKLSSPAHVGLELSARHSAEFFGFYICRFILQDLMMLMDKFMKRATEWILT